MHHRELILDSLAEGVLTADLDSRIAFFDCAAEKDTAVSRSDALGRRRFECFRADVSWWIASSSGSTTRGDAG
jgi:hypothetical protein